MRDYLLPLLLAVALVLALAAATHCALLWHQSTVPPSTEQPYPGEGDRP